MIVTEYVEHFRCEDNENSSLKLCVTELFAPSSLITLKNTCMHHEILPHLQI